MTRPTVLLFQEYATLTTTPSVPDLNTLITGPAYQLMDYATDKTDIEVAGYGTLNADNPYTPPVAATVAISLAAPPGIVAGGWVDPASIAVYFDDCRVIVCSGTGDGVTNVTPPTENTFVAASGNFIVNEVAVGDLLIVEDPAVGVQPDLVLTVTSIVNATTLCVSTNFLFVDATLNWRVERQLNDQLIDSSFVVPPVFRASNVVDILGGVTLTVGTLPKVVAYARTYVQYRAYRTDLQVLDSVQETTDITTNVGPIDSRNPLAVGLYVAKANAGSAPVYYYGVETQDLAGYTKVKDALSTNKDIYDIVPLIVSTPTIAMFKTDNEQLADPLVALANGVPQRFRTVIGSGELVTQEDISGEVVTGTTEALAAAVPPGNRRLTISTLTALAANVRPGDELILSASENVASLDGTYRISHINSTTCVEVDTALPVLVGVAEGINYTVRRPATGATIVALDDNRAFLTHTNVTYTSRVAGATPGDRTIALIEDGTTPGGIQSIVEVAGVSTIIRGNWIAGTITAAVVVAALNSGTGVTLPFSGSVNIVASTLVPGAFPIAFVAAMLSTGTPGTDDLTSVQVLDTVFIRFFDAAATFITDGVVPGDTIEIPTNPNGIYGATFKHFTVGTVVSEQRLQITNAVSGSWVNNSSTVEAELPHLDNRLGTGTLVTQAAIRYRVVRDLTKTQQVANLAAVSQSINSRRAIMVWPDSVDVTDLVDGSLPYVSGSPAPAVAQPGYYLGCAVGGMTAGLPSHQGFSRLGIAAIDRIYNSNDYFTETQLTDISDAGWYVFYQTAPNALPFCIHQLTTDPSTLESGEYSVVKNFDFISLFYLDVLDPFLGIWNINNDTLGFIRQALNTGTDNLKLRRVARIGAPLNNASITSLAVSTASADRVEVYMEVELPKPLNVIGLHLVG